MTDLKPYSNTREDASFRFLGLPTLMRATRETTGGAYGLVEQWMPHGFASPYHRHRDEDEAFYVLEGELAIVCGGEWSVAGPGTFVFGPRGVPHGFEVRSRAGARMLLLCSPGGFEHFTHEMRDPEGTPPGPPDMQKMVTTAAKYDVDILGPLPEHDVTSSAASDEALLDALRAEHVAALESGDACAWSELFTPDGLQMPPNAPANSGRDSIRAWCEAFLSAFRVRFSVSVGEVELAGDRAIETGTYSIALTPADGGPTMEDSGKYITVYRRDAAHGWRVARDIWNSDRPLPIG